MIKFLFLIFGGGGPLIAFAAIDHSFYKIEKEINQSLENSARLNLEKEQLEVKIADLQKKMSEKKIFILKRASALSYLKKYQWGAILAKSESLSVLNRNLKIFERLSQADLSLFKEYKLAIKTLSRTKSELVTKLQQLSAAIKKLKEQQQELQAKENKHLQEVTQNNVASLIKLKGLLSRPLEGPPIWKFGTHFDEAKQYMFVTKGILFQTHPDSEIRAVGPGVIIFRDVLDYWRETLIIQHDDNYYSVYSGIKPGKFNSVTQVEKDQIIGTTDSDEFYFELRHFDNPINPKYWFKETL